MDRRRPDRGSGSSTSRSSRPPAIPIVYADWLHAPGAPTVARLLPLRRPAGRPARAVGHGRRSSRSCATAGWSGAARRTTRASSTCTSGPPRRSWRRAAALPLNLRFVFEGEEESSSAQPRPAGSTANRDRLAADAVVISDTGFFEGNMPGDHASLRGHAVRPDRRHRAAGRPALGQLRRGRPEPGQRPRPDHRRAQGARTAASRVPGFYDDVVPPTPQDARSRSRPAVRRGRLPGARRRAGAGPGEPGFTTPRAQRRPPDARRQRASGAASQGEGSKTIIPAHAHAKVSCRLVPDQDRETDRSSALRDFVLRSPRRASRVEVQQLGDGRPSLTPRRPPGRARRPRGRSRRPSGGRRSTSARAARSRSRRASSDPRAARRPARLHATRTTTPTPRTRRWSSRNYETGLRTIVRLWDELVGLRRDGDLGRYARIGDARPAGATAAT